MWLVSGSWFLRKHFGVPNCWRPRQDMQIEQRGKLEASFIANGKAYGCDGDKLREYVEERLAEVVARDERPQTREMEKREVEESKREEKIEKRPQQLREQQGLRRSDAESDEGETVQRRSPRVEKKRSS